MCGIAAVFDAEGTALLDAGPALTEALRHRGPDDEGWVRRPPVLLVHTRLAIVDLEGGDQPLTSEDGTCTVVVNGEIYNHLELRRELESRGHRFATHSDCEAIVHAYEEWGDGCLSRLNGMFAFALWDDRRQRLLLARDEYGVKPLYWWTDGRRVAAASEVGALLATGVVTAELDPVALDHLFAWRFVPAPRTIFAGVSKLAAASGLVVEGGRAHVFRYRVPPERPLDEVAVDDLAEELRSRLVEAVLRQTMADVPYGAFLSGGLDSAAVVAALARETQVPPETFTIGFPGHDEVLDERPAAAETARLLGARHHTTAMVEDDFRVELARGIRHLEEPCGIPSAPALLQLSRFTRPHVKVVLSGQGADEPLGGYPRHRAAAALGLAGHVPRALVRPASAAVRRLPRNERAKRAARLLGRPAHEALPRIFEITEPALRISLQRAPGEEGEHERRELSHAVLSDVADRDVLEQALYLDTRLFLPDNLLVYGDKMTMAYGLEQRVPFLDVELMRFVERIPAHLRVHRLRSKWLYKRSLAGLVPQRVRERPKHAFATPYDEWLRTNLGQEVVRRYEGVGVLTDLVDRRVVERLVAEHASGREDHKRILYSLLELSAWSERFLGDDPPEVVSGRAGDDPIPVEA